MDTKNQVNQQGTKNKEDKHELSEKPFAHNTGDTYPEQGNDHGSKKVDDMRGPAEVEVGDEKTEEEMAVR